MKFDSGAWEAKKHPSESEPIHCTYQVCPNHTVRGRRCKPRDRDGANHTNPRVVVTKPNITPSVKFGSTTE